MATLTLSDGTTTINLNDGTTYKSSEFDAPPPPAKTAYAGGDSVTRIGEALLAFGHANRQISMNVSITGTDADDLADKASDIEDLLRKAGVYSSNRLGAQVYLTFGATGVTNTVRFNVIRGEFNPLGLGTYRGSASRLILRRLTLTCEPYGLLAEETIENYIRDADFEVAGTALADWTQNATGDHTITFARSTSEAKYGDASVKFTLTGSASGSERRSQIEQTTAVGTFSAGDVVSARIWVKVTAIASASTRAELRLQFQDSGGSQVGSDQISNTVTAVTNGWVALELEGITAPASTSKIRFLVILGTTATGQTATMYYDGALLCKASTLPTTWVSGREVSNHFDDDGQLHTNYFDIEDVPGDVPAILQLRLAEDEVHTKVWIGFRQNSQQRDGSIWHEVEGFAEIDQDTVDANSSGGYYGEVYLQPQFDSAAANASTTGASFNGPNITIAAKNLRLLVVKLHIESSTEQGSGITFDGDAMTLKERADSGGGKTVETWYLLDPNVTTAAPAVTLTGSIACVTSVLSFYGVRSSSQLGTAATNSGSGSTASVSVASAAGDLVVAGIIAAATLAPNGSETERTDQLGSTERGQTETLRASGAATSMTWALGTSTSWDAVGFAIKAATAAVPLILTKSVSSPPTGAFVVLARANEQGTSPDVHIAISAQSSDDPSTAGEYPGDLSGTTFHTYFLGQIKLPVTETPDNATAGAVTLRIAVYSGQSANYDATLRIDSLILLPADFGYVQLSKTSGADVVLIDGYGNNPLSASLLNTSDVLQSRPSDQFSAPPTVGIDGMRGYVVIDDDGGADIDDGVKVKVRVKPRVMALARA